jgi:hypothetical protein
VKFDFFSSATGASVCDFAEMDKISAHAICEILRIIGIVFSSKRGYGRSECSSTTSLCAVPLFVY